MVSVSKHQTRTAKVPSKMMSGITRDSASGILGGWIKELETKVNSQERAIESQDAKIAQYKSELDTIDRRVKTLSDTVLRVLDVLTK